MPIVTQKAELPKAAPIEPVLKQPSTVGAVADAATEAATTPEEKSLSPQYVALARKEKAIRSQAQALKAREEALKAKEAEYETSYISKQKLSDRLKDDPMGFLTEQGMTYDQLAGAILNQPSAQDQAFKKIQAEMQALKDQQAASLSKIEEQQKRAYEQAVSQIRSEAKQLVDSDAAFETIKETGNEEAIVELIKETFEKDGTLLSTEDAAKEVEAYLVEEAFKYAQLKKVKERLNPTPAETPETAEKPKGFQVQQKPALPQHQQIKTLTHAQAAATKPLSNRDRRERAILAFQGRI